MLEVQVEPAFAAEWSKLQHPYEAAVVAALQPSKFLIAAYLRKHGRGVALPVLHPTRASCLRLVQEPA